MDRRLKTLFVILPLAVAGGAGAWMLLPAADEPAVAMAPPPPAVAEHCKRAAELLYEVNWAAACFKAHEEDNDCMLPDAQAARVNAILDAEERRCLSSEMQAMAGR